MQVAAQFGEGGVGKQELIIARKQALAFYRSLESDSEATASRKLFAHISYLATCYPLKGPHLQAVAEETANATIWQAYESQPGSSWWKWYFQHNDACLGAMADTMVEFLDADLRKAWEQANETVDSFNDPRFQHRYLNFEQRRVYIALNVTDQTTAKAYYQALDTFNKFQFKANITHNDLEPLLEVIAGKKRPPRNTALEMLLLIAPHFEAAQEGAPRNIAAASAARSDLMPLFSFYRLEYPESFVRQILESGLQDRNARVRIFAAQGCDGYNRTDLIPLLTKILAGETNVKTRASLAHSLGMLRDGYVFNDRGPEKSSLSVKCKRVYTGGHVLSAEEYGNISTEKLKEMAQRIRRECDSSHG